MCEGGGRWSQRAAEPTELQHELQQPCCNKICNRTVGCKFLFFNRLQERAKGFEPSTSSLGSWHSTTELRPRA